MACAVCVDVKRSPFAANDSYPAMPAVLRFAPEVSVADGENAASYVSATVAPGATGPGMLQVIVLPDFETAPTGAAAPPILNVDSSTTIPAGT